MQATSMHALAGTAVRLPAPTQNRGSRASTSHVHAQAFQQKDCRDMVNVRKEVHVEGSVIVTFRGAEGSEVAVECPKDTYILDAGLEAGLELPFTCRGGICGACVGKITSGSVDQSDVSDLDFTVSEDEQAEGMALLCMSRPVEDCTVETQSDWGYSLGVGEWKGATGHILGREIDPLMEESAR